MKVKKIVSLLAVLSLVGCTSYKYLAHTDQNSETASAYRGVANTINFTAKLEAEKKVSELTSKIFQSYLLGHVAMEKFDQQLETDPESVMDSAVYDKLMAIRMLADGFEHEINDLYLDLVDTSASVLSSDGQKNEAKAALANIGKFMDGIRTNGEELPENLRPMVLTNLMAKQTELYEELKSRQKNQKEEKAKNIFRENMVLLRATRLAYHKDLMNYQVDSELVKSALAQEADKPEFKALEQDIAALSRDIQQYRKALKQDRSTSSNVFFPSAGSAGNITGNGFPQNTWSITYDDGPGGKTTPQVLTHLKNHNMKATFFVLAKQVNALPSTFSATAAAGHDMASHSYTHAQLTKLGPKGLSREIDESKKVIEAKWGQSVKLFRLPYGAGVSNAAIRSKIAANNMIHVFWNVDTLDWQDKNPQKIFNRTIRQMRATKNNAGVVLFHDIHKQSVIASAMLMDYLKKNNLKVCTVQAVVDQINKSLPSCQ